MTTTTLQQRLTSAIAERYVVERELARGGMAVVYLAQDRKHGRHVALKVLDPEAGAAVGAERFHREIALLARLQHPHILPLHDSGEAAGSLFYVMPYVEGASLRQRLQREGALPPADALRVAIDVADALAYAHAQRVVHRDVKPENVLLSGYVPLPATDGGAPAPAHRAGRSWHALVCDFGIARLTGRDTATGATGVTSAQHTAVGHAVGTPTYMSPEQATGDPRVDGRADLWALGAVLYEMLTGAPPYADAPTPQAAFVERLTAPPDGVRRRRPELPRRLARRLDAVIARAVQPDPARRFANAGEMSQALQECLEAISPGREREAAARRGRLTLAAAAVLMLAVAGVGLRGRLPGRSSLDPGLYVVLPFYDPVAPADSLLDGRNTAQLLLDAFARWSDLRLVNTTRVNDAIARGGAPPRNLEEALALARQLGAGKLAWGSVNARGGRSVVRAALYDVERPDHTLREHHVEVRPALPDLDRRFGELADSLLLGSARSRNAVPGALSTTSWNAWRAYDRGHEALARWDLPAAERAFAEAAELDGSYAHAHLWRAQALAWTVAPAPEQWRLAAARALAHARRLTPGEALSARALHALAQGHYPEACAVYRQIVARDSMEFAAWYGLGDCQARDSLVVPDPASPSRWRFRGNYGAALAAYQRALGSLPSVHRAFGGAVVSYLPGLLVANGNQLRVGYRVSGADTVWMGAYPSLLADTLSFVPWPLPDFGAVQPWTMPSTTAAATARNRRLLLEIAEGWAAAFPRSAEVLELLSTARESLGVLDGPAGALAPLRAARARTAADDARARTTLAEVRVLLKAGRFTQARAVCESLLARTPATPYEAGQVAVAAALTGRAPLAAHLSASAALEQRGERAELRAFPPALRAAGRTLAAYAALGGPADSVRAARDRLERLIAADVSAAEQADARRELLAPAMGLAVPVLGSEALRGVDTRGDYLLELAASAARGERSAVLRRLRELTAARASRRATDVSLDAVLLEAWLSAWAGDTAAAIGALDGALDHLPGYGTYMINDVSQAAALVRAMALRAALAERTRDSMRAARWSGAVAALRGTGEEARPAAGAGRGPLR